MGRLKANSISIGINDSPMAAACAEAGMPPEQNLFKFGISSQE